VHVRGAFLMTRAVLPAMLARNAGLVVYTASATWADRRRRACSPIAPPGRNYCLTKSLARRSKAHRRSVNAVAPAPSSRLFEGSRRLAKAASSRLDRFGEPEECGGRLPSVFGSGKPVRRTDVGPNSEM